MPLRPARPAAAERCCITSASLGSSAWMTRPRPGRSMPRAATSVATQTRRGRRAGPGARRCARPGRARPRAPRPEAALGQHRLEVAHRVAGVAEHDRGARLDLAQGVDDDELGLPRQDAEGAVLDVGMRLGLAGDRDAHRVALVGLGQRHDGLRQGGGEQQRAPLGRVAPRMNSRSSRKPRSSISSASSSTAARSADGSRLRRSRWSRRRPGVPTTMWTPSASQRLSRRGSMPPTQETTRAPAGRRARTARGGPGAPVRGSARSRARAARRARAASRRRREASGRAPGRRRRSCPSRSGPRRRGRGLRSRARGRRPGPASGLRSRGRRGPWRGGRAEQETARGFDPG